MSILEKVESALKSMGNIEFEKIIKMDNLSVYDNDLKGQRIIFAVRPKEDIINFSGMQMFLTNIYNHVGLKRGSDFYDFRKEGDWLILGKIVYMEKIATMSCGRFSNIVLEPGVVVESKKEDMSVIEDTKSGDIMRHIAIVLCPTKKVMDYAIEKNELQIGAPANIPNDVLYG